MIFNEEMNYSGTNPVSYPDHSNWKQQAFSNPNAINDGIGPYVSHF
jgi:hypothetical protein